MKNGALDPIVLFEKRIVSSGSYRQYDSVGRRSRSALSEMLAHLSRRRLSGHRRQSNSCVRRVVPTERLHSATQTARSRPLTNIFSIFRH
ncbi:unnamed protein product [Camellia sinensis]